MAHLSGIGIENFRVFKNMAEFEFAPITILTGTNNSGKSSLIKSLLLLKESDINELDFSKDIHKLGSFDKTINFKSKKDTITFSFVTSFECVENPIMLELVYKKILVTNSITDYYIR